MKKFASLFTLGFFFLISSIALGQKPNIHILATGGTIAGVGTSTTSTTYSAGQISVETLLEAVPQIADIAQVHGEQVANIGSQDMSDEMWLRLSKRVNELIQRPDVDAIVITHGTDTMEETAFFLDLTVNSCKPVVMTGAMRPFTALSADGPLNLYNAVVVAASANSRERGLLVTMNGEVHSAAKVAKMHTTAVESFDSPCFGPIGRVSNGKVQYSTPAGQNPIKFNISEVSSLPKVGIIYAHAGISSDIAAAMLSCGYQGIVHAGVGNGNIHKDIFPLLEKARSQGVLVVRSSRVPSGPTTLENEVDDEKYQFVASQYLNPQKSRVLLMLTLTVTDDWRKIQEYFNALATH